MTTGLASLHWLVSVKVSVLNDDWLDGLSYFHTVMAGYFIYQVSPYPLGVFHICEFVSSHQLQ